MKQVKLEFGKDGIICPVLENGSIAYTGEQIVIDEPKHFLSYSNICSLKTGGGYTQGFAHYNGKIFLGRNSNTLQVHDITTGNLIATINLGISLHSNVVCFGKETNGQYPYLYISEWDGERSICVFSITETSGTFSCSLIQRIETNGLSSCGNGYRDFTIDKDRNELILATYNKVSEWHNTEDNRTTWSVFKLPKIADGDSISLTDDNVIKSFELYTLEARQDMVCHNGKVYAISGQPNDCWLTVCDIDKGRYVTKIDMKQISSAEPEGIDLYEDGLIYYSGTSVVKLSF